MLTVSTGDGESLDFSADIVADVEVINASSRTSKKPIEIVGNSTHNSIKGGSGADTISGGGVAVTNDTLTGGKGADTLFSGSGDNAVVGGAGNDSIIASTGSNTITGSAGNDIIHLGGKGNNVINYTSGDGNDTIYSYKTGDKIFLGSSKTKITKATLDGSDYVLTIGKGNITIKDINSDTSIAIVDYSGNETTYTDTVKTAAFTERYFTELPADTWFTSVEASSAVPVEVDSLLDEFSDITAVDLDIADMREFAVNPAEKVLTLNKNHGGIRNENYH